MAVTKTHPTKTKNITITIVPPARRTAAPLSLIHIFTPITSGEVDVFGQNSKGHEKRIYPRSGAIIETPGFYPNLTGTETVSYTHLDVYKRQCHYFPQVASLRNISNFARSDDTYSVAYARIAKVRCV